MNRIQQALKAKGGMMPPPRPPQGGMMPPPPRPPQGGPPRPPQGGPPRPPQGMPMRPPMMANKARGTGPSHTTVRGGFR